MTHGPGALIEMKGGRSGMVMSPDYWKKYEIIRDIRLANYLGVKHFRSPKDGWKETETGRHKLGVQIRDFPKRWYCAKCRYLQNSTWKCYDCDSTDLVVPRVVAACDGGHIQDFPWEFWIGCKCGNGSKIKFPIQKSDSGSDILIECTNCNKSKDLRGALGEIGTKCFGNRPWIGDREANQECKRKPHGMMRGSSNTYFSINIPSILIPPYVSKIYTEIMSQTDISFVENLYRISGGNPAPELIDNFIESTYKSYIENEQYTKQSFLQAFTKLANPQAVTDLKTEEWDIFGDPVETSLRDENPDFSAVINRDLEGHELKKYFDKIVLVKSLTEVIALTGFTRIRTPSPGLEFSDEDLEHPAKSNIREINENKWKLIEEEMLEKYHLYEETRYERRQGNEDRNDWLPAVKNKGEGIFLVLNKSRLEDWESNVFWKNQINKLSENVNYIIKPEGFDETLPRSLLLHTFAHLLSIEISKECGYQLASIKERLYSTEDMYGILLYTSAADSQGSLGGLVTQAQDLDLLSNHIKSMKESASICSQDPLCSEHKPQSTGKPWGASCHSCTNVPETSCERMMNQFLDRHTVVGDKEEKIGYFDD